MNLELEEGIFRIDILGNKIPQLGGLNNRHFLLTALEAEVEDQAASMAGFW